METALKVITLLRQIAFLVLVYALLGWLVDRRIERPDSKVKAFFRVLCSPLTRPVSRWLPPEAAYGRILGVGIGLVAAVWVVLIVLTEVVRRR